MMNGNSLELPLFYYLLITNLGSALISGYNTFHTNIFNTKF